MELQIILNLLNATNDSKFVTRKWNIVKDQLHLNYVVRNEIIYNYLMFVITTMLTF